MKGNITFGRIVIIFLPILRLNMKFEKILTKDYCDVKVEEVVVLVLIMSYFL
jgi:hypothetical protein